VQPADPRLPHDRPSTDDGADPPGDHRAEVSGRTTGLEI
jgi:hypothetical protein